MRRFRSLLGLAVLTAMTACVGDSTAPADQPGLDLQFSVIEPANVSAEETTALGNAFDRVDEYSIVVMDALTLEQIADTIIEIEAGQSLHTLNINVPDDAFGRTVTIELIAYSAGQELYRSTQTLVLEEDLGQLPVELEIRYTGPGIRGQVLDESGNPVPGLTIELLRGQETEQTLTTEDDGTYLFVGLPVDESYRVLPVSGQTGFLCPSYRDVTLSTAEDAVVADFRTEPDPCGVEVLVLSGGDFDDTQEVVTLLEGDQNLTVSSFFYVNQLPGADLLNQHDVVLLFANGLFDESSSLGGQVRDYVDLGGNVVTASFYWQNRGDSGVGSTGWGTLEQVDVMTSTGGANYSPGDLGNVSSTR